MYAVIGKNINYSLSPKMHLANFRSLGINENYIIKNMDDITREIVNLRQLSGFNITVPYKKEIIDFCETISDEAKFVDAVNCVKVIDGKFYGYNTDIYGFLQLLYVNGLNPSDKLVLVIGAGGAGRAIYYCLKNYFNARIVVTNRTINKALDLTNNIVEITNIHLLDFDYVINCTNAGIYDYDSPIEINEVKENAVFIDLNYQNHSKFLNDAKNLGAKTIDGLDMLIYQGAKSFEIWFNQKADIHAIRNSLRKE